MTPIVRTPQTTTARRRSTSVAHRAAEGTITGYLRDVSAGGRRHAAPVVPRVRGVVPARPPGTPQP